MPGGVPDTHRRSEFFYVPLVQLRSFCGDLVPVALCTRLPDLSSTRAVWGGKLFPIHPAVFADWTEISLNSTCDAPRRGGLGNPHYG